MKRLKGILCLIVIVLMTSINQVQASPIKDGFDAVDIKLVIENREEIKEINTRVYQNFVVTLFDSKDLKGIVETKEKYIEIGNLQKIEGIVVNNTDTGYKITKNITKRDYDWYLNQQESGFYRNINCGPTVAVMGVKWNNKNFNITPEMARDNNIKNGGAWNTSDIKDFINSNNGFAYYEEYFNYDSIKKELDLGNLVILCLDVRYLGATNPNGHYIVVHDYIKKGDELFFITHDPDLGGVKKAGKFIGKNKEYNSKDVDKAIINWWKNIIVVENQIGE